MKKLLLIFLGLVIAIPAYATIGLKPTYPLNSFIVGNTTNLLNSTTSPFFPTFSFANATGTSATTTNFFSSNASTTNLFGTLINGFSLATCNSTSNALSWAGGVFGCNTITGGNSKWATSTVNSNAISPNSATVVGIGTNNPTGVNANAKLTIAGTGVQVVAASTTDITTSSTAIFEAYADTAKTYIGSHGSLQVPVRFGISLGGWGEIAATSTTNSVALQGLVLGTVTSAPLVFGTTNLERMRIDSAGNLTVGSTTGYAKTTIWDNNAGTTRSFAVMNSASGSPFEVWNNGQVGINVPKNTSAAFNLEVYGSASTTNATTTTFGITSIASGNCLQTSTGGTVVSAGAACGSGSGGGNSKWATTTTNGLLSISPNGGTTVAVAVGSSSPAFGGLMVESTTTNPAFVISHSGSTTPTFWVNGTNGNGLIGIGSSNPTSPLLINWDATTTIGFQTNAGNNIGSAVPVLKLGSVALSAPNGNGTFIGVNEPANFIGDEINLQRNGTTDFKVNQGQASAVQFTASGNITAGAAATIQFSGRSKMLSSADGSIELENTAGIDFTRVNFGGTTSAFPALTIATKTLSIIVSLGGGANGGQFAVGTSTPRALVTFASSTAPQLTLSDNLATDNFWNLRNTGGSLIFATSSPSTFATSTANSIFLDINGGLNLGTWINQNCNGTTLALGTTGGLITCDSLVSDARLKKDISPISDGIAVINALKPVSFKFIDNTDHDTKDPRTQSGFIAQDVMRVIPSAVGTTSPKALTKGEPTLTLDKTAIIPYLVSGMQSLWSDVQHLIARVSGLEARVNSQQKQIENLNARLTRLENK